MKWITIALLMLSLIGCTTIQPSVPLEKPIESPKEISPVPTPILPSQPLPSSVPFLPLSWESNFPERVEYWSKPLLTLIAADLPLYLKADDIEDLCPMIHQIPVDKQLKAIGEFWVAVAYHESGYDPTSSGVDVGEKGKRDTYSIGLFQVSVVDQKNLDLGLSYTYEQLLKAKPNIEVAMAIMHRQLTRNNLIMLKNDNPDRNWATFLIGNEYSQIPDIKKRIKARSPSCYAAAG